MREVEEVREGSSDGDSVAEGKGKTANRSERAKARLIKTFRKWAAAEVVVEGVQADQLRAREWHRGKRHDGSEIGGGDVQESAMEDEGLGRCQVTSEL